MAQIDPQRVAAAYDALASGNQDRIREFWDDRIRWRVPGHNMLSGWKNNLGEFLDFMATVGRLSDNSFRMDLVAVATGEDVSCDITHNLGRRAGQDGRTLDIDVVHFLRWRDGKVIEGQGAIFGDGTARYDEFWA